MQLIKIRKNPHCGACIPNKNFANQQKDAQFFIQFRNSRLCIFLQNCILSFFVDPLPPHINPSSSVSVDESTTVKWQKQGLMCKHIWAFQVYMYKIRCWKRNKKDLGAKFSTCALDITITVTIPPIALSKQRTTSARFAMADIYIVLGWPHVTQNTFVCIVFFVMTHKDHRLTWRTVPSQRRLPHTSVKNFRWKLFHNKHRISTWTQSIRMRNAARSVVAFVWTKLQWETFEWVGSIICTRIHFILVAKRLPKTTFMQEQLSHKGVF